MTDSKRFRKIDESNIEDHYHLEEDDICYYLFEYTSKKGFQYSLDNELIINLKKSPIKKHLSEYEYKINAINFCSK